MAVKALEASTLQAFESAKAYDCIIVFNFRAGAVKEESLVQKELIRGRKGGWFKADKWLFKCLRWSRESASYLQPA